jgi:hypothetical protein
MTTILFKPLFPILWVFIALLLVLCLLAWLEVKRNQKFLVARLVALLLAILSIACLIGNPAFSVKKTSNGIVLTPGYQKEILDSLLTADSKSQVYTLQGVTGINNAVEINSYRDLGGLEGNLSFLGEGMPRYMLEYIDTSSLQYFPAPNPEGFIAINFNKIYTANQRGELNGILSLSGHPTVRLIGPGGAEDSLRLSAEHPHSFSLTFTPKASGLYLYTLTASDSSGKIRFTEQIPVQVKKQESLSVLFLSDYPTAEFRFLKNFLEGQNHKLTLHYKISKDKYRTEFINTPKKSIGRLNGDLLKHFDLVLTDASYLSSLSVSEIKTLKEATQGGLGILTLINTSAPPKQVNDILNVKFTKIKSDSAQLLVNDKRLKIPAAPLNISSDKKLFSVLREPSGRMVSGYYHSGLGKSGFQLLTNTFSVELAGEKEAYAELWTPVLEAIARKESVTYDLRFTTPFPYYRDEPIEFKIIAAAEKPTVKMGALEITLVEDPLIKNIWFGKIWAGEPGWNALNIDQDSSQHNFFVSQNEGWRSLQIFNQQKSMEKLSSPKEHIVEQVHFQPVPRVIFFLIFLLSVGFLWLSPKL